MMRTIYSILVALLLMTANSYGQLLQDDGQKSKSEIILTTRQGLGDYERSSYNEIKAFYLPLLSKLEINCPAEGLVSVYLFNFRNQMCGYAEFDSSETPVEWLDVPKQSGTYHIVIITDKSYSEGTFVK